MSIPGVALTGRLILKEKQLGGPSVPHEVEAFRDLVQPILDLSLLCADIGCRILSAGLNKRLVSTIDDWIVEGKNLT